MENNAQQPVSEVRSYFTEDINSQISGMSDGEMLSLLKELSDTRFWIAILRYNQERLAFSQNFLFSADPFKDPTSIARYQGVLMGLSDLQNAVIMTLSAEEEKAKEAEAEAGQNDGTD